MEIGRHTVTIVEGNIITVNDKPVCSVRVTFSDGEEADSFIFMTEKSMGMARAQLKVCGFDPDVTGVDALVDNPGLIAGKVIDVVVEDYNGRLQVKIPTRSTPPKSTLDRLTKGLRAAKGKNEESAPASTAAPAATAAPKAKPAAFPPPPKEELPNLDDIPF